MFKLSISVVMAGDFRGACSDGRVSCSDQVRSVLICVCRIPCE